MTFEQHIIDNDDDRFPGHQLIVGVQDGREVWRSWADDEIPIEARLNIDHPEAHDKRKGAPKGQKVRWRMPDAEVASMLESGAPSAAPNRQKLLDAARERGLDVSAEVKRRVGVKPGKPSPT